MKHLYAILLAVIALTSCSQQKESTQESAQEKAKVLVLYYSQTDATKAVAQEIQKPLGADIEAIELEKPYNGTYDETIERCKKEMDLWQRWSAGKHSRPCKGSARCRRGHRRLRSA